MGVDQAGKDGLAGGVDNLNALGKVLHSTGILDLAVIVDENEGVLDRLGTGASMSLPPTIAYLVDMVPPYGSI